jgi:mono/diheme cytochrome c family protein
MKFTKITTLFALAALHFNIAFADVAEGEKLFTANCVSCHAINEKIVGPALKDVHTRREEKWLVSWIKNSQKMIKSGDPIAVQLNTEYNGLVMTSFEQLSDDNIKSIIAYVKQQSEAPAAPVQAGTTSTDAVGTIASTESQTIYNDTTFIALALMAVILLVVVLVLYRIKQTVDGIYLEKFGKTDDGLTTADLIKENKSTLSYKLFKKHPVVGTILVSLGFTVVLGIYGFNYGNTEVGVQQDYAPTQPINYSHELHAGTYKINCLYCHSGADKSKQATIPSASTCMNCHMHVTASAKYDGNVSPEIQKIYDAVGWDGEKKMYDESKPKTPIKWVRIHNLPDLAYFNHAQHVNAGKVECQACHGPIEKMAVVAQQSTLQMGWCINCHREAKVDVANNDYYEKLHADLKAQGKSYATVEQVGGLECGKCHY